MDRLLHQSPPANLDSESLRLWRTLVNAAKRLSETLSTPAASVDGLHTVIDLDLALIVDEFLLG